jgi:two-component system, LytTR family, sensor kinase
VERMSSRHTSPVTFPVPFGRLLALGPLVAVASGTLSYILQGWLIPSMPSTPQGQYVWVILFNILSWTAWLASLPVAWMVADRIVIRDGRRALPLVFHVCASLVFALVHSALNAGFKLGVLTIAGQQTLLGRPLAFGPLFTWALLYTFEWQCLLYWGIIAAHHALRASLELRRREVSGARLEARLVESQLESLQRQLNPHFFFNALNTLTGLVHRDPHAAESMLVRLGDLLRAVFRSQVQQEVPLSRELTLLEQYLDIQRVRFAGRLGSTFDIDEEARGVLVPVLLLQPLAENAIKHGFGGLSVGGQVSVSARRSGDQLELRVADDGRARQEDRRPIVEGIGLGNTRQRLEHLYPGAHTMSAGPMGEGGFQVTIRLPWRREASDPLDDALDIPA